MQQQTRISIPGRLCANSFNMKYQVLYTGQKPYQVNTENINLNMHLFYSFFRNLQYQKLCLIIVFDNVVDYKSLPIEDQIYLTRNKCLDLLIISVVSQSCVNAKENTSSLHFSISEEQREELTAEKERVQPKTPADKV